MNNTPDRKRVLGLWMLISLVTGNMIGSGIFLVPSALASFGSIGLYAWVFTAVGAVLLALVFAKLSQLLPKTGGHYVYCREAFGDFIGFLVAYNYWLVLWIGNAAIALALVGYLTPIWPALKNDHNASYLLSVGMVWLFTLINIKGVKEAGFMQVLTTVLKLIPLVVIGVLGIFYIKPEYLHVFNVTGNSNFVAFSGAATLTLWSFVGVESATVPAESAKNPVRDIPRATIIGTLLAAAIYIVCAIVIMGVIPNAQLAQSTAPFADAAKVILGNWGSIAIAIGAVISCAGALNGWILLQGQVPMAAAHDKLFPSIFGKQNRFGVPAWGLIVSSILITILLTMEREMSLVKQFTFIILLTNMSALIPYLFTTMAELLIFMKHPEKVAGQKLFKDCLIALAAFVYVFWAIAGGDIKIVYYGTLLLFSGVPVYVWMKWRLGNEKELVS